MAVLKERLAPEDFRKAWAEGREMKVKQAVGFVLNEIVT
jgi:hypothetical protein